MIALTTLALALAVGELQAPFLAQANGKPIAAPVGHLAPILTDVDADGLPDLVVGTFSPGDIRVYRNIGKPGSPKFGAFTSLQAGGKEIRVEAG